MNCRWRAASIVCFGDFGFLGAECGTVPAVALRGDGKTVVGGIVLEGAVVGWGRFIDAKTWVRHSGWVRGKVAHQRELMGVLGRDG